MKTLLTTLLLFTVLNVIGQPIDKGDNVISIPKTGDTIFIDGCLYVLLGGDSIKLIKYLEFEQKIQQYLADYEEYMAECYADSTPCCKYISDSFEGLFIMDCDCTMIDPGSSLGMYHEETIWIRREPNFNEFMKFLKRKYNQN